MKSKKVIEDFTEDEIKRIKHKIKNHKQHDIKKGRQVKIKLDNGLIGYRETQLKFIDCINLIIKDGLKCYYCKSELKIIPPHARYAKQMTFDRINNNEHHHIENLKICCLSCNQLRSNKYTHSEFMKFFIF